MVNYSWNMQVHTEQTNKCKSRRTPLSKEARSEVKFFSTKEGRGQVIKKESSKVGKIASGTRKLAISHGLVDISTPKGVSHVGKRRVTEEKLMPLEDIIAEVRAIVIRARQVNIQKKDRSAGIKNERKKHRSLKGATIKTRVAVLKRQRVKEPKKETDVPVEKKILRELQVLNTKQVPKEEYIPNKKEITKKEKVSKKDFVPKKKQIVKEEHDTEKEQRLEESRGLKREQLSKEDCVSNERHVVKEEPVVVQKQVIKEIEVLKTEVVKSVIKEKEEKLVVKKPSLPKSEAVPKPKPSVISTPLLEIPRAKTVSSIQQEQVSEPKGRSNMEKFKAFFKIEKKEQVMEKISSPTKAASPEARSLVVSKSSVTSPKIHVFSFVEKDQVPEPKSETVMDKFKLFFKKEKKEQASEKSPSPVKSVSHSTAPETSDPLAVASKDKPVLCDEKKQVDISNGNSGIEKFKAFFNIHKKELTSLAKPHPENKEINESPNNTKSFFKRNDGGTSLSPSPSPYPFPLMEKYEQYIESQQPQEVPMLRPNMLDDVRRQFYERYPSQKSSSQRKQYHPGGNLAPGFRKMIDSKITNEPYRFLDKGCNEVQVFDPNYVPIYDSMYDSSLFDDTEYILECVLAKMVKPEGWKVRVEDFKSSWEYGRFVTDCIVLDSTVLNGIRNGGKYVGTAISKLWRKDP